MLDTSASIELVPAPNSATRVLIDETFCDRIVNAFFYNTDVFGFSLDSVLVALSLGPEGPIVQLFIAKKLGETYLPPLLRSVQQMDDPLFLLYIDFVFSQLTLICFLGNPNGHHEYCKYLSVEKKLHACQQAYLLILMREDFV